MLRKLFAGLLLALAVTSCEFAGAVYDAATTPMDMVTVRKAALSTDIAYKGALDLAVAYAELPKCVEGGPVLCANVVVIDKIIAADAKAAPLVTAMNKTVQDPTTDVSIAHAAVKAATEAVAALKEALPVKPVEGDTK